MSTGRRSTFLLLRKQLSASTDNQNKCNLELLSQVLCNFLLVFRCLSLGVGAADVQVGNIMVRLVAAV